MDRWVGTDPKYRAVHIRGAVPGESPTAPCGRAANPAPPDVTNRGAPRFAGPSHAATLLAAGRRAGRRDEGDTPRAETPDLLQGVTPWVARSTSQSFLAGIDEKFNLDDDQIQDQDQAAANANNSAELADVRNEQLGALDQNTDTETNTVAGDGGAGGVAVGGDSGSADGTGIGGDGGSIRLDGNQNVNFGDSSGGAGLGFGGVTGDGGDASADGGDGGSNDVRVDVDADADQRFDSDQDVEQDSDQDGTNVQDADADADSDTNIDNETDVEDESEEAFAID